MTINPDLQGRSYPAAEVYERGREKIREFARAVKATHPAHFDVAAAEALGHSDLGRPPTFHHRRAARRRATDGSDLRDRLLPRGPRRPAVYPPPPDHRGRPAGRRAARRRRPRHGRRSHDHHAFGNLRAPQIAAAFRSTPRREPVATASLVHPGPRATVTMTVDIARILRSARTSAAAASPSPAPTS